MQTHVNTHTGNCTLQYSPLLLGLVKNFLGVTPQSQIWPGFLGSPPDGIKEIMLCTKIHKNKH